MNIATATPHFELNLCGKEAPRTCPSPRRRCEDAHKSGDHARNRMQEHPAALSTTQIASRMREETIKVKKIPPHKAKGPFDVENPDESLVLGVLEASDEIIIRVLKEPGGEAIWQALSSRNSSWEHALQSEAVD